MFFQRKPGPSVYEEGVPETYGSWNLSLSAPVKVLIKKVPLLNEKRDTNSRLENLKVLSTYFNLHRLNVEV